MKFATTPKMSSYLVALTVGDCKCIYDHVDGVKVSVCTVPGKENLAQFPLAASKAFLHYYNNYYGIKYPLPKLDNIAVPDFQAGAMENWGAIIYRETALLIDEKTASVGAKAERRRHHRARDGAPVVRRPGHHAVVGRHLAERGLRHLDDPAPGFGVAARLDGEPGCCRRTRFSRWAAILSRTPGRSTRTLRPAGEIEQLFDGIAYGKSASVLHMLESYLGPQTLPRRGEPLPEGACLRKRDRRRLSGTR